MVVVTAAVEGLAAAAREAEERVEEDLEGVERAVAVEVAAMAEEATGAEVMAAAATVPVETGSAAVATWAVEEMAEGGKEAGLGAVQVAMRAVAAAAEEL